MKDKIKIAAVNFASAWGCKEENLKRICSFCIKAGMQNADLLLFPETALTGYDNDKTASKTDKMHVRLAETIPGESTLKIAELAQKYNMYIVFGMPEKEDKKIYNSAAIISPDRKITSYRKLHPAFDEKEWSEKGCKPVIIESEWGKIGVTICYDTYCFPELIRYYRAQGARLILNATACPDNPCTLGAAMLSLPAYAYINYRNYAANSLKALLPLILKPIIFC